MSGFKVLGTTEDLPRFIDDIDVEEVVITLDTAGPKEIRRVVDLCSELGVRTQIVPSLDELAMGKVSINRLRDVQIDDLLGREPVVLDTANLSGLLSGRTVMVTGAGGSIGSELVRQIVNFGPAKVVLVERSEYSMFQIVREFGERYESIEIAPVIADVRDAGRMKQVFAEYGPQVVFHAAAHKHVSLMENNVAEAVATSGARLVDVSSGIESAPGVKDATKIAAFLKTVAAL